MAEPLPVFVYHPDPIATGSVVPSSATCRRCGEVRGFIYVGPVYSIEELTEALCPWCIADGSAAAAYEAEFTDVGWGVPEGVPNQVVHQVARQTPGFGGWQQEHWLYHCNDAAAFLGRAGYEQLRGLEDALDMLRGEQSGIGWASEQIEGYIRSLHTDGDATAYLFKCRHCGKHLAYSDFS